MYVTRASATVRTGFCLIVRMPETSPRPPCGLERARHLDAFDLEHGKLVRLVGRVEDRGSCMSASRFGTPELRVVGQP